MSDRTVDQGRIDSAIRAESCERLTRRNTSRGADRSPGQRCAWELKGSESIFVNPEAMMVVVVDVVPACHDVAANPRARILDPDLP